MRTPVSGWFSHSTQVAEPALAPGARRTLAHLTGAIALLSCLSTGLVAVWAAMPAVSAQDDDAVPFGPPPLYDALRNAEIAHAGQILAGRLQVDRFDIELTNGHLYLTPAIDGTFTTAVFLGEGLVRAYPPDAVEHHQLEKLSDEHHVAEAFDRMLLWSAGDAISRLQALATPAAERDTDRANRLVENRRKNRLQQQLDNPDSRILTDLLRRQARTLESDRTYLAAEFDSKDNGWLTLEVEPLADEEVLLYRHDTSRRVTDTWLNTHRLADFDADDQTAVLEGFAVDPDLLDEDDVTGAALGLAIRPLAPGGNDRPPHATVPRIQVDMSFESDGDTTATAALLIETMEPTRVVRLRISPTLEVTDVRWRPGGASDADLLPADALQSPDQEPDSPVAVTGEPLHFVQERHDRLLDDDRFEPWVTVALPRTAQPGERFILELAYEGSLIERQRTTLDFLLKDSIYWYPRHPDSNASQLDLKFRVPERYRVASAGRLADEQVVDDTRILRWVIDHQVRSMAFHYGEFDVTEVQMDDGPTVSLYGNDNHLGFRPGAREKTITDLTDSIRLYSDYFGPFPYDSLLVTETATLSGQAFPGLVLLSFQAFGELHTGEAELFRAHEVAHQWWGAGIDWAGYRDQWMTEGFANYSAALYALYALDDTRQFEEMINAWRLDVLGEGQVGQGLGLRHYGFRPEMLRRSDGHESGALVVGYRLNSSETPFDYRILAYEKGAYILHMLRSMLLDPETGDDERFRALMRSYATERVGGVMSTRSFEAAVTRAFGEPMDWFFDQWVYGTAVPTYRPDLDVSPVVDSVFPFVLHGTVRQEDVPEGFKMPVPVRVTFDDRPPLTFQIWVDAEEVQVEILLPERPDDVVFNYRHAVLGKVR